MLLRLLPLCFPSSILTLLLSILLFLPLSPCYLRHALGVTNATASQLPQATEQSVFIEGTAHCADLYAPANSDPASLTYAREVISGLVDKWLA